MVDETCDICGQPKHRHMGVTGTGLVCPRNVFTFRHRRASTPAVPDDALVTNLRGQLAYSESIVRAYANATGFDHAAACPICNGIEGCSHSFIERFVRCFVDMEDQRK